MEALVLFDIDGTTAVVSANLLIDADGCSAVEATKDLDTQYLKSSTWYVMNGGKRLLVEVLDISNDRKELDAFETDWVQTHRAIHIRQLIEKKIKGGYLSSWPDDSDDGAVDIDPEKLKDLRKQVQHKRKLPSKDQLPSKRQACSINKKGSEKTVTKTARTPNVRGPGVQTTSKIKETPRVGRTHTAPKSCRRSLTSVLKTKTARTPNVRGPVVKTANKIKATRIPKPSSEAVLTSNNSKPAKASKTSGGAAQTSNKTKPTRTPKTSSAAVLTSDKTQSARPSGSGAAVQTSKTKVSRPVQKSAASSKERNVKTGSKNREIVVLYEGSHEPTIVDAAPARKPGYRDHLTRDQNELLNLQLNEHSNNKRTMGCQTEKVLLFDTLEELSQASEQAATIEAEQALHRQTKDIVTRVDKLETLITEKF